MNQLARLGFIFFLTISSSLIAQNISISPYSGFGYGDKRFNSDAATFGMADVSTTYLSPFGSESNFNNPAANSNLRFTNFVFEGGTDLSNFDNGDKDFSRSTTYVSKISLGFPLTKKFKAGFGFQPYSAVGYKTGNFISESSAGTTIKDFDADGGLNSLHAMLSYELTDNLSLGLRTNYIFGNINKRESIREISSPITAEYNNRNKLNGALVAGGLHYRRKIGESHQMTIGAVYSLGSNISTEQEYLISTYLLDSNNQKTLVDTVYYQDAEPKVRLPQSVSFGVSYGESLKWSIGAQVDWEKNSAFQLKYDNQELNDRFRLALGGYIIPRFNSYKSYFARATYRAGAFYEQTPVTVNSHDVEKYGITFGIGLPVGKANDPSKINLGVQLGQRGKIDDGLIKENFANFRLSFTLNDSWFQRRKYD